MTARNASLATTVVSLALVYGVWHTYSLALVALLAEFGWSRSVLAGAFSVMLLVHGAASPMAGAACARIPPRWLIAGGGALLGLALAAVSAITTPAQFYLAFGVLTAVPLAASGWIPHLVQVQREFPDRLGLAMGIASAGVGMGAFLVVPLFQGWTDAYGWRNAFRILAALCAGWIVPSALLLARSDRSGAVPPAAVASPVDATRDAPDDTRAAAPTLAEAMRGSPVAPLLALYFMGNFSAQMLNTHQAAFFVDRGMLAAHASTVVAGVGAASIFGKIAGGWLSDRLGRERVYVTGITCLVAGIATLAFVGAPPDPVLPYAYALLFGLGYAATSALLPAMIADRYGGRHYGAVVGLGLACGALGAALGAWLAGWLFDRTGSYALPFGLAVGCGAGAAAIAWRTHRQRTRGARVAAGVSP